MLVVLNTIVNHNTIITEQVLYVGLLSYLYIRLWLLHQYQYRRYIEYWHHTFVWGVVTHAQYSASSFILSTMQRTYL